MTQETDHQTRYRNDGEEGYTLPLAALLLIPMLIFAAFAVDVGSWYAEAEKLQRAVDAAALAAVGEPSDALALAAAQDAFERNGLDRDLLVQDNVVRTGSRITVRATTDGDLYFGQLVLDQVDITRFASADLLSPVRMGNPSSGLGLGDARACTAVDPSCDATNQYLHLTGFCNGDHNGGYISSPWHADAEDFDNCDGYTPGNNWTSYTGMPGVQGLNSRYDPEGYFYIIEVPDGYDGTDQLFIYHPQRCNTDFSVEKLDKTPPIHATVFAADVFNLDNINTTAAPVVAERNVTPADNCPTGSDWVSLYAIPANSSGETVAYALRIRSAVAGSNADRNFKERNVYGLLIGSSGGPGNGCTSVPTPPATTSTCPRIFPQKQLPVAIVRELVLPQGEPAEFYLAELKPDHAGMTLEVNLNDAGEKQNVIAFIDPAGNDVPFTWEVEEVADRPNRFKGSGLPLVWTDGMVDSHTACDGPDVGNDNTGLTNCLIVEAVQSGDNFVGSDGQKEPFGFGVTVKVHIPITAPCSGSNCWWKVRYIPDKNQSAHDRTTWTARVLGGPIHLVD